MVKLEKNREKTKKNTRLVLYMKNKKENLYKVNLNSKQKKKKTLGGKTKPKTLK